MKLIKNIIFLAIISSLFAFLSSCSGQKLDINQQKPEYSEAEFIVTLPAPLLQGETLYFEIVDEVTGIALNPSRYKMDTSDNQTFSIRLPFTDHSIVKYRYVKQSQESTIEKDTLGNKVVYRTFLVDSPMAVNDFVAAWDDKGYPGIKGEISGFIYDEKSQAPLGEILVTINGMRTFTTHDGFFEFRNVPVGAYQISAIHIDGYYLPFQQKAIIAENSVTPASFGMTPTDLVDVTFSVKVPEYTDTKASVRLLGNTASLGNAFSELDGGTSIIASKSIVMENVGNGFYEAMLRLPAGLDFRYKYTLGDGFLNAEHDQNGSYKTRQIIIPSKNALKSDIVESWYSQKGYSVTFKIKAPVNTPTGDFVTLQLNPFTWLNPVSLWKTDENQWQYTLYSPLEYLNNASYRFCRNNLCGITDDEITRGLSPEAFKLDLSNNQPIQIDYQISQWYGLDPSDYAIQSASIPSQNSVKIKSFSISPNFKPEWLTSMDPGLIEMGVSGANWLFFSPTWKFDGNRSEFQPGLNYFASDIISIKNKTNNAGLSLAIFPQIDQSGSGENYWLSANLSYQWWQKWFSSYKRFILNYAIFAEANDLNTLVIGGSSVSPAFPAGKLPNGNYSNSPYNSKEQWVGLLDDLRTRYSGQVGFALPLSSTDTDFAYEIGGKADFIFVEIDVPLSDSDNPTIEQMNEKINQLLDVQLLGYYTKVQKPIMLSINVPSIDGASKYCIFSPACTRINGALTDENEQADIYQALLNSVAERNWIIGVDSAGFNPSAYVKDTSPSVLGKPAMDVLKYYYLNFK